jgi:hypothetical protein
MFPDEMKLTAHVDDQNERSIRVLKRLGFKEVGRGPVEMVELGKRTEILFKISSEDGLKPRKEHIASKVDGLSSVGDQLAKVPEVDIV